MNTDSISDLLTRIRNANMVYLEDIELPASKMVVEVSRILTDEGFLKKYSMATSEEGRKNIKLSLKYGSGRRRVISGLKRVSRPGRRVYASVNELKKYKKTFGVTILSTPKGVITDRTAYKEKVGGEVLCMVW